LLREKFFQGFIVALSVVGAALDCLFGRRQDTRVCYLFRQV